MQASKIIASDFLNDLRSPYARRWFLGGFLILIAACLSALYFMGDLKEAATGVLVNIIAGSLIILAGFFLYYYFIGFPEREVSVIRPQDIGHAMARLREGPGLYMFWGRSGSYFRAHPLLEMDRLSTAMKAVSDVVVILPDADEQRLAEAYRSILKSLNEIQDGNPLLHNVLATSIACAVVASNNRLLNMRLYYSKFLPAFRIDLSDRGAIITQDDPAKAALYFAPDSEFYQMFKTTMQSETSVARPVKIEESLFKNKTLDGRAVDKATLESFGLKIENVSETQSEVARLIIEKKHRYK